MTRFLFTADWHLGAGDRKDDQLRVLSEIAWIAEERKVDAVLFGGDATHHRSVVAEVALFQVFLSGIADLGIPFYAIPGNHDRSTMAVQSTIEVAAKGFANANVMPVPHEIGHPIGGVHVCALPWCPTSAIAAMDPTGQVDDVSRTATEILMDIARSLRASVEGPAVLLLHWSISGAVTPTGALTDEFREVVLPANELAELGFDAILAGHIHSAGMVGAHSVPVLYAGSPAVCDWGEADTPHGVWIIDLIDGVTRCEFVSVPDRPFVTVAYAPGGEGLIFEMGQQIEGAIVRVRYSTTAELERVTDHEAIRRELLEMGAHRVAAIQPDIQRADGVRIAVTEDVSIDDAFEQWLATQSTPDTTTVDQALAVHHEIREAVR